LWCLTTTGPSCGRRQRLRLYVQDEFLESPVRNDGSSAIEASDSVEFKFRPSGRASTELRFRGNCSTRRRRQGHGRKENETARSARALSPNSMSVTRYPGRTLERLRSRSRDYAPTSTKQRNIPWIGKSPQRNSRKHLDFDREMLATISKRSFPEDRGLVEICSHYHIRNSLVEMARPGRALSLNSMSALEGSFLTECILSALFLQLTEEEKRRS
jgi:hypothetical protein